MGRRTDEAVTKELVLLADKVEVRNGGEAVLKGTYVEVHRVAALLAGGMSPEDVLADYSSLSAEQIGDAKAYAAAHLKPERPYPRTYFKRATQGAGLEALDEVLDH